MTSEHIQQMLAQALKDHRAGRLAEAETAYRKVLAQSPNNPEALHLLGLAAHEKGSSKTGLSLIRKALTLRGDDADMLRNLAAILISLNRPEEAVVFQEREARVNPGDPETLCRLGNTLSGLGRYEDALSRFQQALEQNPNSAEAHWGRAFIRLLKGDYAEGWADYEWRTKHDGLALPRQEIPYPAWDGSPLDGGRILLHAEQGYGDILQFSRFAPQVAHMGGQVVLACPKALRRLMGTLAGVELIVSGRDAVPEIHHHAPLMSLPAILGTTLETVSPDRPYLASDPALSSIWAPRIEPHPGIKVGIAWRGSAGHTGDLDRSGEARLFSPLAHVEGVCLFSLQMETTAEELDALPGIIDLASEFQDFADTAAALEHLDLVISVDTAVVHLAGALGCPAWVLLAFAPDWRWLLDRDDSPWYPSVRLFRQPERGDWPTVMETVTDALKSLSN